jgi:NADPH:quinone reductase-like Zn-dependent oxidoreductase
MSGGALPTGMKALELRSHAGDPPQLALVDRELPKPRRGEVLVRLAAAPINPNDLLFLRDRYDIRKARPVVPGFEGSGTVVGAGGGLVARAMLGRRVACMADKGDGTWAEYATVAATRCVPLRGRVDLDAGATMLTNPFTAMVLASRAHKEGHRGVVLTAAAGSLGRMLSRACAHRGLAVVHIVRRSSQVAFLRSEGAEHVVDSATEGFDEELSGLCARLGVTLALDAVAGELTGRIINAMPPKSIVRVYGRLSDQACRIDPDEIVFRGKRLEGFTMYDWARETSVLMQFATAIKVQSLLTSMLRTQVQARLKLEAHAEALSLAAKYATDGKVLFVF